jgi:hypothetical protein
MIDGFTSILIQIFGIGLIIFIISFITSKEFRKNTLNQSKEVKITISIIFLFAIFLILFIFKFQ